ncbi:MAG: TIGR02099 family protein [Betaproteobacteria bacterium]|nr:MAG: TIGR02099 family protein [Betaproteobacteria bacterium]
MPLKSTRPDTARAAKSLPRAILSFGSRVLVASIAAFCILLLAIRYVVFPQLESHRGQISDLLAQQIGQPVELGALASGWDGWNPRLDVKDFRVVDRQSGATLLSLPALHLTLAWTSLLFVDLRFKELALERPELAVRRDASGMLHIAGLTFGLDHSASESKLADWLLRQRRILIHDAAVVWIDDHRDAPPLTLKRVEFRLENRFGRHRFGLTGVPPAEVAAPIDIRGDVRGRSLGEWHASSGRLYARLDYADVAAWRVWLPLPIDLRSGKGALRVWLEYAGGEPREIVADLVLTDVETRLAPELRELALARLEGRIGWRSQPGTREFFTKRLTFAGAGGARFDPTDFKLTLHDATAREIASGTIEFNNLQLAPLTQVAENLPLPKRWREDLARYNPKGTLTEGSLQWNGEATAPDGYAARGQFTDLGLAEQDGWPGLSGVTGSFEATQKGGSVRLASRAITVELPRIFDEKLALDSIQGRIGWQREDGETAITLEQIAFANAHLAGSANGTYHTAAEGPGSIDLTAQIARGDVRQAYRYLPLKLPPAVRGWLRRSLVAGTASEGHLKLSGNLADFPFADAKKGTLQVDIKGQGVTLDYADQWPPLAELEGEFRIDGPRLSVEARSGRVFTTAITHAKVGIADLRTPGTVIQVEGDAAGPTSDFLRFVAESPVAEWTGHVTEGADVTGTGRLALKIELPLAKLSATHIDGEYTLASNRLKLTGAVPVLNQLSGKLAFTEHDMRAQQLTAEVLGGTARLSIASSVGHVHVGGQGTADLAQLRAEFPKVAMAKRVSGTTDWQLAIDTNGDASTGTLETSLRGASIDLPPPLAKAAGDAVPLRLERHIAERGRDTVAVRYGRVGQLTLQRRITPTVTTVDRGLLVLGEGGGGEPDRPGLWIRGNVASLDADAWLVVKHDAEVAAATDDLSLRGIDVMVRELDVFSRRFNDLHIGATRGADAWQVDLSGRELAGGAQWQAASPSRPNGRIAARLQRLTVPAPAPAPEVAAASAASAKAEATATPNPWPEIDIVADSFLLHGRDLGKLELTAQPRGPDWQIQRLLLASDDGKLSATGWWRASERAQLTTLDAELDITDAGKYLARFGMPDAVRGAPTKVRGQIGWAGGPEAFDYPTLSGAFRIDSNAGQFTKVDPGVGKLLGVLSLQSLQRRLSFDFRDVFGEGFAFDELTGNVTIQNGVMHSDNLRIVGPSARVAIAGEADIAKETQRLKVRVQPSLSAGVSVGAAVLLLANPIIGAAVGAGSLLAQKVLQDPIEQIFSFEYVVSGGWSDPVVERNGRQPASVVGPAAEANGNRR